MASQCTLFAVETVDEAPVPEAVEDEQAGELVIPCAASGSTGEKFAVTVTAAFNIKSITDIGKNKFALQGEACAKASGALLS